MPAAVGEFDLDSLMRLPLPLAQLVRRAHNAPDARARHNNAFFLFEATIKLAASVLVAGYARDLEAGEPRNAALDQPLSKLQKPSLGHWVGILRELSRHFGRRADAPSHPLGHFAAQLEEPRRDHIAMLNLFRRIKNGPDAKPSGDQSCSLLALFDALTTYRNTVMGHGADRCDAFYEQEMGPLLLPAAADLLAEGVLDFLGPSGSRLAYLGEVRKLDDDRFEVGLRELLGAGSMRVEPLILNAAQAQRISPNRLAVLWRGHPLPLRLDPLLVYREAPLNEEVRFLNSDRGKQIEYLSYMSGETERDPTTVADLGRLLELVAGHAPQIESEELVAIAPPIERDFEILAEIGRGGMGVIYLARQISLGRLVALKMLPAELSGDEVALARFNREIRALGQCDDPHIVKVLTSGKFPDGQRYYAMEYVPGADLDVVWQELAGKGRQSSASNLGSTTWSRAVLTACRHKRTETLQRASALTSSGRAAEPTVGGAAHPAIPSTSLGDAAARSPEAAALLAHLAPLPELSAAEQDAGDHARRVATLIRDAARALQTVHDQGIVHRDVKPANLMLTPDGTRVVLMDFGLAKGNTRTLEASRMAGLLGTLRYAAPEQLAAAQVKVGPKADVRGLGVTLFELLTRHRLFEDAVDESQLTSWVLTKPVPRLCKIDPTLDPDLEAIVAAATELSQDDRLSARQLADLLDLYLAGKPLPIRLPGMVELLRRWVRDHKRLVGAIIAAAAAIVIGVTTGFALINAAKNRAQQAEKDLDSKNRDLLTANAELDISRRSLDVKNRDLTEATHRIERQLALSYIERGTNGLSRGDKYRGLAILGQAYRAAHNDPDLRASVRTLLGGWYWPGLQRLHHSDPVYVVAFSPDGTKVLTGSWDNTARLWDVATGKPLGEPLRHEDKVMAVAFSPDGTKVLTGSLDKTARLWDAATGKPLGEPLRHHSQVQTVTFSPDGTKLLTQSRNIPAQLWDAITGKPLDIPIQYGAEVGAMAFSPDGNKLLTGSLDKTARLWDVATGKPLGEPLRHDAEVYAVKFSPDGTKLLTVSGSIGSGEARLWDAATGKSLGAPLRHLGTLISAAFSPDGTKVVTLGIGHWALLWDAATGRSFGEPLRHDDQVWAVAFSPDGTKVLTGSWDKTARLWDAATGKPLGEPLQHDAEVVAVAFSPDGTKVLTGSDDHTARLWDATAVEPLGERLQHDAEVWAVAFSPDGTKALTGSSDKTARLWDTATGRPLGELLQHQAQVSAVAFSPDGSKVLTGSWDKTARLWDAATGKPLGEPLQHDAEVRALKFSPDGTKLLTGSDDHTAQLWDTVTGKPIGQPLKHDRGVPAIAFSPDGTMVLTGSTDETARLWDAGTGKPLGQPLRHDDQVMAVAFSPDGTKVLTGSLDKTARLWDAATSRPIGAPFRHKSTVGAVAFSPDGTKLLTGSADKTARLWDMATGKPFGEPLQHDAEIWAVAFSSDGTKVLTGSYDRTAQLWDTATCKPIGQPLRHNGGVNAVAFSPDGTKVLTGSSDKTARLWWVPSALPDDASLVAAYTVVASEFDEDSGGVLIATTSDQQLAQWHKLIEIGNQWLQRRNDGVPRNALLWHKGEAADNELRGDWFAAEFHLRFLLKDAPNDPDLLLRHEHAKQSLAAARAAQHQASSPSPNLEKAPRSSTE